VEYLEGRVTPANISWTGLGDGLQWSDPRNWSSRTQLPGPNDDVTIGAYLTVIQHSSGSDTIHSLNSNTPIVLSGGSLDLVSDSLINTALVITGGQLINQGNLGISGLNQSGGTITGDGPETILYQWSWSGGVETGNGHTVLQGTAYLSSSSSGAPSVDRILDNFGVATLISGSSLDFTNDGVWNNQNGRSFVLQQGASFTGTGQFNNLGQLQVTGSARSGVEFDNTDAGGVDVVSGTFTLTTGQNYGTFQIESGATVAFDNAGNYPYNLTDGANIIGNGTLQLSAANQLNLSGNVYIQNLSVTGGFMILADQSSLIVANLTLAGGTITGTGEVDVTTTTTWTSGTLAGNGVVYLQGTAHLSGGALSVLDQRTVNNIGNTTISDDGITFAESAVFNNQYGYNLTFANGGSIGLADSSGAVLNNLGSLSITDASTIGCDVTSNGTVAIRAGQSLEIGGTWIQYDGLITVDGTLTVDNTLNMQHLVQGNGIINGNVINAGELAPGGNSPGRLTINGDYTQLPGGKLDIQLNGPSQGDQYAQLVINGNATLAGALNILRQPDYVPAPGIAFQVMTFHSHRGDFQFYVNLDLGNGRYLDHHFSSDGTSLILQS
jgi:hypothetical protein